MSKNSPPRWTEEQLQQWLSQRGEKTATSSPPSGPRQRRAPTPAVAGGDGEAKKRRGIEVKPFIDSIRHCPIMIEVDHERHALSVLFEGAKLLSLNELYSIQQFRRYEYFKYKKAWREAVDRAMAQVGRQDWRQVFPGPVDLTLFRRSPKANDPDSSRAIFKSIIDAFVKHKYVLDGKKHCGVIADDNRDHVVGINEFYSEGKPAVGVRFELCINPPPRIEIHPETEWFGPRPSQHSFDFQ